MSHSPTRSRLACPATERVSQQPSGAGRNSRGEKAAPCDLSAPTIFDVLPRGHANPALNLFGDEPVMNRDLSTSVADEFEGLAQAEVKVANAQPYFRTLQQLPAQLQNKEIERQACYPQYLEKDEGNLFDLSIVHSGDAAYRGRDMPTFGFGGKNNKRNWRQKRNCKIVVLDDNSEPVAAFGNSFEDAASMAREYPHIRQDVQNASCRISPATQRPSIDLELVLERLDDGTSSKVVFFTCWATNLSSSDDHIAFDLKFGAQAEPLAFEAHFPDIVLSRQRNEIVRFEVQLKTNGAECNWNGITEQEKVQCLDYFAGNTGPGTCMHLIGALLNFGRVCIYETARAQHQDSFEPFKTFTRAVNYISARLGMFWYYKLAAPGTTLEDPAYPFDKVPPPRWLIKEWHVKYDKSGTPIAASALRWDRMPKPWIPKYPDAGVQAFEMRLAISREGMLSYRKLNHANLLAKNLEIQCAFLSSSTAGHDTYIAEMHFRSKSTDDAKLGEIGSGTRCQIRLRTGSGYSISLKGQTIENPFSNHWARLTEAVKTTDPNTAKISNEDKFVVELTFPTDRTATNREQLAVASLQSGHIRSKGIHFGEFALGAPRPRDQDRIAFSHYMTENGRLQKYRAEIARARLNEDQLRATELLISPNTNGAVNVHGPPGTGKTYVTSACAKGLVANDISIAITATGNEAVNNQLEVFLANHHLQDFNPLSICRFSGAFARPDIREKCRAENQMDVDDQGEAKSPAELEEQLNNEIERQALDNAFEWLALHSGDKNSKLSDISFERQKRTFVDQILKAGQPDGSAAMYSVDPASLTLPDTLSEEQRSSRIRAEQTRLSRKLERDQRTWSDARQYFELMQSLLHTEPHTRLDQLKAQRETFLDLDESWTRRYFGIVRVLGITNNACAHRGIKGLYHPMVLLQDEAGQSTPGNAMVAYAAFKESVQVLLLSGDHKQLSPVALSECANEAFNALKTSLFEQHMDSTYLGTPSVMLAMQYRMHPDISAFCNKHVYGGQLRDAPGLAENSQFDKGIGIALGNLWARGLWNSRRRLAIDCSGEYPNLGLGIGAGTAISQSFEHSPSFYNISEALTAMTLTNDLMVHGGVAANDIKIISPYQGQRSYIEKLLRDATISSTNTVNFRDLKVLSTHQAPGQESQVVIVSLVRNDPQNPQGIGFIWRPDQINVELTRARRMLIVLGNFRGWMRCENSSLRSRWRHPERSTFRAFVRDCVARNDVVTMRDYFEARKGDSAQPMLPEFTQADYCSALPPQPEVAGKTYLGIPDAPQYHGGVEEAEGDFQPPFVQAL